MNTYRNCPYAYKLHYLDRKKAIFWNPDVLDLGGLIHDVLDVYYKNYYISEGTTDDILNKSYGYLRGIWDTSYPVEYLQKARTCLENHADWEHSNIDGAISTKPLTEVKINTEDYFGIIDYVDLENKKVIDWKTGAKPYLSYTYRMQAYVYKKLYEKQFDEKLSHFYFYFLYPNEWRTVKYDNEKQTKVNEETEKLKNDILNSIQDEVFEKNPRTKSGCKNCGYRLYCKIIGGENSG